MNDADVETVRRIWLAHREGRIDDMLDEFSADAVWRPLARPGRSVYVGHEGIRQMLADIAQGAGPHRLDVIGVRERNDGKVVGRCLLVLERDTGDEPAFTIDFVFELRDGAVISVDSLEVPTDDTT